MHVAGVDGCRGGWIAALVSDGDVAWRHVRDVADVLAEPATVIGIDVPIGIPNEGVRACDREARARVGARRSSVFPAPVRGVLSVPSYAAARQLLADRGAASLSAQAFGLVPAIRNVDAVMTPALESRVIEVHPELSFATMYDAPLAAKKTAAGVGQRIAALSRWLDVVPALASVPPGVPIDDALDALACAWTAERFARAVAETLGDGARDGHGLLMRIVV